MPNPLFSTYRAGENRVTSSTMAVFERIDLDLVRELLVRSSGLGGDELSGISFENQIVGESATPDARITAHFTWWFEAKTVPNGYAGEGHNRDQLRAESEHLVDHPEAFLFVLTPDSVRPSWFDSLDGIDPAVREHIAWISFATLSDQIREIIGDASRVLGEQTRALLSELVALYEADGLLSNDDTVVVAAGSAWGEYPRHSAYMCQPDRAFRTGLSHLAFYHRGQIMDRVPKILGHIPSVIFSEESAQRQEAAGHQTLATLIRHNLASRDRLEGESYGVILLSGPDDPETVKLARPITNDSHSESGRTVAYTMGQRYARLDRLEKARKTSDL